MLTLVRMSNTRLDTCTMDAQLLNPCNLGYLWMLAFFDIPTSENILQYQSNIPIILSMTKARYLSYVQINKICKRKTVNIFLSVSFNVCFRCLKVPSH